MSRHLAIVVPDAVTSHLVVATADPPRDPLTVLRRELTGGPNRPARPALRVARDLLDTPMLEVRTDRAVWSDFAADVTAAPTGDDEAASRLRRATHHLVVAGHAPPLAQPEHAQAARAVARILAMVSAGVVYDVRSAQVLPAGLRFQPEPATFRLADHWLSCLMTADVPRERLRYETCDEFGTPRTEPSVHVETGGLHRFGLPDLALPGAPRAGWWRALNLLRGLAVRLLTEHWDWLRHHPGESAREIGEHLWVEARDVWGYWGCEPAFGADARVRIRLVRPPDESPGAPPFLNVMPPVDFPGCRQDWLENVVIPAMPAVTRWPRPAAA